MNTATPSQIPLCAARSLDLWCSSCTIHSSFAIVHQSSKIYPCILFPFATICWHSPSSITWLQSFVVIASTLPALSTYSSDQFHSLMTMHIPVSLIVQDLSSSYPLLMLVYSSIQTATDPALSIQSHRYNLNYQTYNMFLLVLEIIHLPSIQVHQMILQ